MCMANSRVTSVRVAASGNRGGSPDADSPLREGISPGLLDQTRRGVETSESGERSVERLNRTGDSAVESDVVVERRWTTNVEVTSVEVARVGFRCACLCRSVDGVSGEIDKLGRTKRRINEVAGIGNRVGTRGRTVDFNRQSLDRAASPRSIRRRPAIDGVRIRCGVITHRDVAGEARGIDDVERDRARGAATREIGPRDNLINFTRQVCLNGRYIPLNRGNVPLNRSNVPLDISQVGDQINNITLRVGMASRSHIGEVHRNYNITHSGGNGNRSHPGDRGNRCVSRGNVLYIPFNRRNTRVKIIQDIIYIPENLPYIPLKNIHLLRRTRFSECRKLFS